MSEIIFYLLSLETTAFLIGAKHLLINYNLHSMKTLSSVNAH
jgi:hypothetical protein